MGRIERGEIEEKLLKDAVAAQIMAESQLSVDEKRILALGDKILSSGLEAGEAYEAAVSSVPGFREVFEKVIARQEILFGQLKEIGKPL